MDSVGFDLKKMQVYKDESVEEYRSMIRSLLNRKNVTLIHGTAKLHKCNVVEVEGTDGSFSCVGKNVILATGAEPAIPDIPGVDLPQVLTSRDILRADEWHFDRLVIIGGGVIGIEIATIFSALGSRVTLLEKSSKLLETMDPMISDQLEESLRSKGIDVICNASVMEIRSRGDDSVAVSYREEGSWQEIAADRILLAVGRRPDMNRPILRMGE